MTQSKTKKSDAVILDSLADLDQAITDGGQPGGLAEALADLIRRNGVSLATAKPPPAETAKATAETGPADDDD
jgi:hypothetical protein